MRIRRDWLLLIGALVVIGALYNHYLGHSVLLFELVLLAIGAVLGLLSIWGRPSEGRDASEEKGLVTTFLSRYVGERAIGIAIPVAGFVLLISWSAWKVVSNGETNLRMEDFIVTLFCLSLILYHSAPTEYHEQRDFVLLYLLFLTIVFAGLWKLYTVLTGESYANITMYSEYYFVTVPVVSAVNLFGVDAAAVLNVSGIGLSNIIEYYYEGRLVRLGVGTGCSGLYSAGLFFSAFLAFVLVRYRRVDGRILLGLGAGLLVTWFSNILRMIVTILVGSEFGAPALATFHMYFGIILFIAFVLVFWFLVIRWLDGCEARRARPVGAEPVGDGGEPAEEAAADDAAAEDGPDAAKASVPGRCDAFEG